MLFLIVSKKDYMIQIFFIMLGGALGALSRFWVSIGMHKYLGMGFPWGTLVVNAIGSFAIGFLWGIWERTGLSPELKAFLFVGILGGFTTFSSFSLETLNLFKAGDYKLALLNVLANNLVSISLVVGGYFLGKFFAPHFSAG